MKSKPFKIAAIVTAYHEMSHADVIVSRWLEPHPRDCEQGWNPKSQISSLYVDQMPEGDGVYHGMTKRREPFDFSRHIGRAVAKYYHVPVFSTVRDALTLGSNALTVDAVLLIGEHGDYPLNRLGQKLYPRKELFFAITQIMRETGKVVPLFNDKHLSWNPACAHAMIKEAKQLNMPLFAGSSLAFAGMSPEYPANQEPVEMMHLFSADLEAYSYHSIEFAQNILDRHCDTPRQAIAVSAYRGQEVWRAAEKGFWSKSLQEELLRRAYPRDAENIASLEPNATAFHIDYSDGSRVIHIHVPQHGCGFHLGARLVSGGTVFSRARTNLKDTFFSHFASLNREIESFFLTGCPPYPPERSLETTCLLADCMAATEFPGVRKDRLRQNIPLS